MRKQFTMILLAMGIQAFGQQTITIENQTPSKQLLLSEELRFGAIEEDDAYLWSDPRTKILPAPDEGMFVFDLAASRVLLFDSQGALVKQVARQGQGPGELQYITSVSRSASGNIYIMDTPSQGNESRMKRFNPDMSYKDELNLVGLNLRPDTLMVSPNERYLGGLFVTYDHKTQDLVLKNGLLRLADNTLVNLFYQDHSPMFDDAQRTQGEWVDLIALSLQQKHRMGLMALGPDGTIYTASKNKYEINLLQPGHNKPYRIIVNTVKPRPISQQERADRVEERWSSMSEAGRSVISRSTLERAYEEAELVAQLPLLAIIPLTNQGFLAVRQASPDGLNQADVYSNEGQLLAILTMQHSAMVKDANRWTLEQRLVFDEEKAYTIITDEDGEHRAVRYSWRFAAR